VAELARQRGLLTDAAFAQLGDEAARGEAAAGETVGRFVLVQEVGRGRFGAVYKAWQADLKRFVALKLLSSNDPVDVKRFDREAKGALSRPGGPARGARPPAPASGSSPCPSRSESGVSPSSRR
jgi:hypothetical protein